MGIFQRQFSSADLAEKIKGFDAETKQLEDKRERAARSLSAALAAGTGDVRKLRASLLELADELIARPEALRALEREHRRALRAQKTAALHADQTTVKTFSKKLDQAAEGLVAALSALDATLAAWRDLLAAQPAIGRSGDIVSFSVFADAARLRSLGAVVESFVAGRTPVTVLQDRIRHSVVAIEQQLKAGIASRLEKVESEETADPELLAETEAELSAAAAR